MRPEDSVQNRYLRRWLAPDADGYRPDMKTSRSLRLEEAVLEPISFEGQTVPEEVFLEVTDQALRALEKAGVRYGLMGGVASAVYGRPRWTHDLDVFIRQIDTDTVLSALEDAGFATQRTDDFWIYKGIKHGVLVDLIFRAKGDIFLDDEMISRLVDADFKGVSAKLISPEDLITIKAIIHDEATPRHWHDALAIIAAQDLDWEYLARRARHGVRRVLSLLLYALSVDLHVPESAVRRIYETVYEP
jgi:predicted nucleotidyltransferase